MDSLTQVVLGAAVAEAAIGRRVGRRAALFGAVLGTLPDLDVFVSFGGVVEDFVYHRGASHSLLVLMHDFARDSLRQQNVAYEQLLVQAAPFTSLAWRIVAVRGGVSYCLWCAGSDPATNARGSAYNANR
jgi:membrane-bound metal-dependent hydrolase YbcI (DUF457 family)